MQIIIKNGVAMRTTVSIEDALYESAIELLDPMIERKEIFREAMKTFVRVQSAKRLAQLGSKIEHMHIVPRRRDDVRPG